MKDPAPLTTADPTDLAAAAFVFTFQPAAGQTQTVLVINDPDRLADLINRHAGAACWGRKAFWRFVYSLRKEARAGAPDGPEETPPGDAGDSTDDEQPEGATTGPDAASPAPTAPGGIQEAYLRKKDPSRASGPTLTPAQDAAGAIFASVNSLKIEFGPSAIALITGDPSDWFRRIGADLPKDNDREDRESQPGVRRGRIIRKPPEDYGNKTST